MDCLIPESIYQRPNWYKIISYNENLESFGEVIDEINHEEARYNEQLRPHDAQIRALDEMKQRVVQEGISRGIVSNIRELTGNDTMLESYGLSIESFTTYPSRINMHVALEELSENHKNILIGGAIGLGLALVAKIIWTIYKWIKGRGGGKEMDKELKEKQEQFKEQIKKNQPINQEFMQAVQKEKELKEVYDNLIQESHTAMSLAESDNKECWTKLLEAALTQNGHYALLKKVFEQFKGYENGAETCYQHAAELNSSIDVWVSDGKFGEHIDRLLKDVNSKFPPEQLKGNIQELNDNVDVLLGLADETSNINDEIINKVIDNIRSSSDAAYLANLGNWSPFQSKMGSDDYLEKTKSILESLNNRIHNIQQGDIKNVSKEDLEKMKHFVNLYRDCCKTFAKSMTLYMRITGQYERFLKVLSRLEREKSSLISKVWSKLTQAQREKPACAKLKKLLEEKYK